MLLPRSHIQERLSEAYVRAVLARTDFSLQWNKEREYGVDFKIQRIVKLRNGKLTESGPSLECQLKASTACKIKDKQVVYDMEVTDYNKLVSVDDRLLILYHMPANINYWIQVTEEKLILQKCCYWAHIKGPWSDNISQQRVFIPNDQLFTPDSIDTLLCKLRLGEFSHERTTD
jgi:hypothetical protein